MLNRQGKSIVKAIFLLWIVCPGDIASLDCYSCQGINCQRTTKVNESATCPNQWDDCVTIFSGTTATERGCYSTIPQRYREKCDEQFSAECHKCSGNLCNNLGAASCIQCSNKNNKDKACALTPKAVEQSRCPLSVGLNTYCFVRADTQKGVIERGCLTDLREQVKCLDDLNRCKLCIPFSGIACNDDIMALASVATQASQYSFAIVVISCLVRSLWS